ncbi:MAG: TetR/AcrR family transcriptional regulator [Cyanobacteria bacterium P01_A01_bin.114]
MATPSSRERLIQAASELFLSQGVSHTTTRQIANLASVNEVTLFRNFGNKYGLLLAVIQEAPTFRDLGEALMQQAIPTGDMRQALKAHASNCLHALEQAPAFVRSLIGEADQYPDENRQALGHRLDEASRYVAQYLQQVMPPGQFSPEKLAGFLTTLLIGYVVIESTSKSHHLWENREDFLGGLVDLVINGAIAPALTEPASASSTLPSTPLDVVEDLPAPRVQQILQQAKAAGHQDYALAYVLFGAGLLPGEVVRLVRSHHISDKSQHTLQVGTRQVPINQWILGKRYGSYTSNPLTKWLKSRKDDLPWLFIDDDGAALTINMLQTRWQTWTEPLQLMPMPDPTQAKQTWCVEMLMRGMTVDNLSILSGWEPEQLEPYVRRAKEKAALEQARALDQKG